MVIAEAHDNWQIIINRQIDIYLCKRYTRYRTQTRVFIVRLYNNNQLFVALTKWLFDEQMRQRFAAIHQLLHCLPLYSFSK